MAIQCGSSGHSHDTLTELKVCQGVLPASGSGPGYPRPAAPAPAACMSFRELADAVPAGWFAVPSATGSNDLDFFQVDKPKDGKWKGYAFVSRIIGGHDPQPVRGRAAAQALTAILREGIEKAMGTYGQKIGRCGDCNRSLTDELSRQIGRGPVCREKTSAA
jgi:hypothetical protein